MRLQLIILICRWLRRLYSIGFKGSIEEDDLYDVTKSMRSEQNTKRFEQLWNEELTKQNPSILRVMLKSGGIKVLIIGFLFSIADTFARYIHIFHAIFTFSH